MRTESTKSTGTTRLLYPKAEKYLDASKKVERPWDGTLAGKRVCIVDNGRPNALEVLSIIEKELKAKYKMQLRWIHKRDHGVAGRIPWTNMPLPPMAVGLENEIDVLITGIGN
jgi:hypothetical protein